MNELVSSLRSFATWRVLRASILCGLVASVVGCGSSGSAPEQLPDDPAVKGPITGPREPFVAGTLGINLADVGYEQAEYFISGTAASYTNVGELDADGQWEVEGADTAEFNTRILVYRPVDANAFSGTVFVEWLNVSGGVDAAPDWSATHTEILREGHVWVGVSAQIVGIEGSDSGFGLHLKQVNPERYGELLHPGDSFSYDMYAQAAQAVRNPVDIKASGRARRGTGGDAFQLDEVGNVLGGIRTNYVDAPEAVLSGLGQTGDSFCRIFGTTMLFDDAQLAELYPTRDTYLDAVNASTQSAVDGGYLLPVDAALIVAWAEASDIGVP